MISGFQHPLYSCPNLGGWDEVASLRRVESGLNGRTEPGFFRQVAFEGFTGQLIRASARLVGHAAELSFLVGAELDFHNLRL